MSEFISGQWNAICDVCGFKFKSSELRKRWDGYMVCQKDYEHRHPMDFMKPKPETAVPEWTRPRPADVFVEVTYSSTGTQDNTIPDGTFDGSL